MPNEGGGVEHCSICHLTMGRCEPRVIATVSSNGQGGKEKEGFCMSIGGFKQAMGTSELIASVVPGLEPIGKGNFRLNLEVFLKTSGDHVQRLAARLPAHLVRQFLSVSVAPSPRKTASTLCVVQA